MWRRLRLWLLATLGLGLLAAPAAAIEGRLAGADVVGAVRAAGLAMAVVLVASLALAGAVLAVWGVLPADTTAPPLRRARALVGGSLLLLHLALSLAAARYLAAHYRDPILMAMVEAALATALALLFLALAVGLADRLCPALERLAAGEGGRRPPASGRAGLALVAAASLGVSAWACALTFASERPPSDSGRLDTAAAGWLDAATDLDGDGVGSLRSPRDCAVLDDAIHPGAKDVRANQIDEDCDGRDRPSRHQRKRERRGGEPAP